ncbi:MAG: 6-phosphogluconolactonase [Nitrospirae bacterium]|nr:6-phosphogluconolactonase [Nitrospirota bacterium]
MARAFVGAPSNIEVTPIIERHPTREALVAAAAEAVTRAIGDAVARSGLCRVALSGGETPRALYARLAQQPRADAIPWSHTRWFFGDERWVPRHAAESTFAMVNDALFSKVTIPPSHIFPVPTDARDPQAGASAYEATLRAQFGRVPWPAFDLILMGLGTDGHTASLFPGDAALAERGAWVTTTRAGRPIPDRVTLTVPVFAHARAMLFLVAGSSKAGAVAATLGGPRDPARWPAQGVAPVAGRCLWLLDSEAAALL